MSGRSPLFRGATTVVVPRTAAQGGGVSKQSLETSRHEDTLRASDVDTPEKLALQLNRLQRLAGNNTRGARTLPFNGGTYFPSQSLVAGQTNSFAHGCNGPAAFLAARVRPSAGTAPIIVEVGQTGDGRIQIATTANCLADLFFYPQPGLTNIGPSTKLAGPFSPSVTPTQTSGGGGASVGLAAARPAATGSGRLYFCTDVPVMYVDDPSLKAWVQFNQVYTPAGPAAASYTVVGAGLGLTQYADSILAQQASATASITAAALAAGSLPQASSWTVTLAAAVMIPTTTFPSFGLCVSNGTSSGVSEVWMIHLYGNNDTSSVLEVLTATLGANFISSLTSFATLLPTIIGNTNCLHFRLLNDGNVLHFQYGNGQSWLDMYTLLSPAGLTNYGFVFGPSNGQANSRAMATVLENTLGTLTVPQASISAAAPAGAATVFTTSAPHGLVTGDWVSIYGILGLTGANTNAAPGAGFASDATTVIVTGASTFTLPGVTTAGTYTSGGTVTLVSR